MEIKHVEYIQDIAFNDLCDKMAISTTSQKIIIYKKVSIKSNELILPEIEPKEEEINTKPKNNDLTNKKQNNTNKKSKEYSNRSLYSKNNLRKKKDFNLNDIKELKNKRPSSRSLINVENSESKNNKNEEEEEDPNEFFFSNSKNSSLFKSISFGTKYNYKLDRINYGTLSDIADDSFDSMYSPSILKYKENKQYEYRWEKIISWNTDGPALRLQWAYSEFGNILACCGYNKWIYIFKEENCENNKIWSFIQIKNFSNSVEDISFVPKNYSLGLASITSDGFLKIFSPLKNELNWELKHELNISKWGCTCLCCNPCNLDELTIVIGCKKKLITLDIKNDKNKINNDKKKVSKETSKRSDSIIKNQFNDLIKIIYYGSDNIPIIGAISECGHEDDITDVDWANQNGRLHHMICSTSKDGKFIIWEINLNPEDNNQINDKSKINNDKNCF